MSRTATPAPLDDGGMWRRVLARVHPDGGGGHEEFLFLMAVREALAEPCGCRRNSMTGHRTEQPTEERPERIPYDPSLGLPDTFTELTMRAFDVGFEEGDPYRSILALLTNCPTHDHGRQELKQRRGASYRQLAYIAHLSGLTGEERKAWYEIARSVPLSEKHAGHLIERLKSWG